MKKKLALLALVAGLAGVLGAGVAVAAVGAAHDPAPEAAAGPTEGVVLGDAPTTRVAVWIDGQGPGSHLLRRAKGVTAVTNPQDGTFCIRSGLTSFRPSRVFPVVSVDYSLSEQNTSMAQWRSNRPFCPTGTIEIHTFDSQTGLDDNTVSFTVVIP